MLISQHRTHKLIHNLWRVLNEKVKDYTLSRKQNLFTILYGTYEDMWQWWIVNNIIL